MFDVEKSLAVKFDYTCIGTIAFGQNESAERTEHDARPIRQTKRVRLADAGRK
jgi:hypothetical protein